jgi:hypothetical protein
MDKKLKLKPIELLDIGIDKLTKIPVPILSDNMVSTFDMENGLPSDSFIFTFDSHYSSGVFSITLVPDPAYPVSLSFNYGDNNIETILINTGGTIISHPYINESIYTITIGGWIEKINSLIVSPSGTTDGGVLTASITKIKGLNYLDLSSNKLTNIILDGLINLNTIKLDDNYFPNDVIDDLYIEADTFPRYSGYMSTVGTNNGKPSIYSTYARDSLVEKGWTLSYNV